MKNLITLIDKTKTLTLELHATLSEERLALTKQDTSVLEQVIQKKLGITQNLQASDAERDLALTKLGVTSGQAGMEEVLAKYTDRQLHDSWQSLCEVTLRCKEENLLVGTMIRKSQLVTDQALQVLRKGRIDSTQTYSATGITPKHSEPKTIGKA